MSVILLTALTATGGLDGPPHFETSDDGHEVAIVNRAEPAGGVAAGAAPYPLVPDWVNDVRRQVGGLQAADMNADGLVDLVAGVYNSNSFPPYDDWHNLIYYNVGGALEPSASWISADEVSTGDIQVALINDDPYPDVFSANGGFAMDSSVIYFGSPTGPDTTPGWSSNDVAWNNYALPFDFDHDGDVDVVTANQGNSPADPFRPMYLFRNVGGVLDTTPSWQSAETSIQNFLAFGDLDGDGWEDLAVSKWVNFESGVYGNLAGGDLDTTPMWTTGDDDTDKGIAWADVDGNGDVDLALGHDPTQLFLNDGGTLSLSWGATTSFFGHSELRFHDVDDDGDEDLAEVHFSNGQAHIYLNHDGTLSAAPDWTFDSSVVGTAIAFGDISGNGRDDLIVANAGEPSIMVFYNTLPPLVCDGDVDADGQVAVGDLIAVILAWGFCDDCAEDVDGSGRVDVGDLVAVILAWGPCT